MAGTIGATLASNYTHKDGVLRLTMEIEVDPVDLDADLDPDRVAFYASEVAVSVLLGIAQEASRRVEAERDATQGAPEGDLS